MNTSTITAIGIIMGGKSKISVEKRLQAALLIKDNSELFHRTLQVCEKYSITTNTGLWDRFGPLAEELRARKMLKTSQKNDELPASRTAKAKPEKEPKASKGSLLQKFARKVKEKDSLSSNEEIALDALEREKARMVQLACDEPDSVFLSESAFDQLDELLKEAHKTSWIYYSDEIEEFKSEVRNLAYGIWRVESAIEFMRRCHRRDDLTLPNFCGHAKKIVEKDYPHDFRPIEKLDEGNTEKHLANLHEFILVALGTTAKRCMEETRWGGKDSDNDFDRIVEKALEDIIDEDDPEPMDLLKPSNWETEFQRVRQETYETMMTKEMDALRQTMKEEPQKIFLSTSVFDNLDMLVEKIGTEHPRERVELFELSIRVHAASSAFEHMIGLLEGKLLELGSGDERSALERQIISTSSEKEWGIKFQLTSAIKSRANYLRFIASELRITTQILDTMDDWGGLSLQVIDEEEISRAQDRFKSLESDISSEVRGEVERVVNTLMGSEKAFTLRRYLQELGTEQTNELGLAKVNDEAEEFLAKRLYMGLEGEYMETGDLKILGQILESGSHTHQPGLFQVGCLGLVPCPHCGGHFRMEANYISNEEETLDLSYLEIHVLSAGHPLTYDRNRIADVYWGYLSQNLADKIPAIERILGL